MANVLSTETVFILWDQLYKLRRLMKFHCVSEKVDDRVLTTWNECILPLMSSLFSRMEQELRLPKCTENLSRDISSLPVGEQIVFFNYSLFERYSRKSSRKLLS